MGSQYINNGGALSEIESISSSQSSSQELEEEKQKDQESISVTVADPMAANEDKSFFGIQNKYKKKTDNIIMSP